MKQWTVTINAENEEEAVKLLNFLIETFKVADKFNEPLDHVYADKNGAIGDNLICERNKNYE